MVFGDDDKALQFQREEREMSWLAILVFLVFSDSSQQTNSWDGYIVWKHQQQQTSKSSKNVWSKKN